MLTKQLPSLDKVPKWSAIAIAAPLAVTAIAYLVFKTIRVNVNVDVNVDLKR